MELDLDPCLSSSELGQVVHQNKCRQDIREEVTGNMGSTHTCFFIFYIPSITESCQK